MDDYRFSVTFLNMLGRITYAIKDHEIELEKEFKKFNLKREYLKTNVEIAIVCISKYVFKSTFTFNLFYNIYIYIDTTNRVQTLDKGICA